MKFSITGQYKGDLLIQVTAWKGLNVIENCSNFVLDCLTHFDYSNYREPIILPLCIAMKI